MWNDKLLCRFATVDPERMPSLPMRMNVDMGFDVFAHTFESRINVNLGGVHRGRRARRLSEELPAAERGASGMKRQALRRLVVAQLHRGEATRVESPR